MASIKHGSEQALSFVKTFGLSVEKVVLRSPTKIVELTYNLPESFAGCSSSSSTAADKETGNVDETLFLLGSPMNVITRRPNCSLSFHVHTW